ncbi:MAG TPA: sodium-dependent transporter [Nevskiales bacterium]|nr:sodium-dependent transporter [Nevskiales bacterium]
MTARAGVYGYWSSPRAFVMVAAGATIGFGNMFSLPYLLGQYGGGAFLLVYVLCLFFVSLPLIMAELLMGRRGRANVVTSTRLLAEEAQMHVPAIWSAMAWLALLGAMLVLSYYSVIAGWSMAFTIRAAAGVLSQKTPAEMREILLALVGDPERALTWHTIFMISATIFVAHGRAGLERVAGYLMPMAFVSLLLLLVCALAVGDLGAGLRLLLTPDFSRLGWQGVLEALQQAFFSLALGMGVMMTLGLYMPERVSLPVVGGAVILVDLLFALMSGLAVFAFIFAVGEAPTYGVRLVFQQLPLVVGGHTGSQLILVFLYLSLFLATMTSAIGLMEPVVVWLMERYELSRSMASSTTGVVIWFFGLGTLLSFNVWQDLLLFGKTFYQWLELLTGHVLLPLIGLGVCVFVSRAMPLDLLREAWGGGSHWSFQVWRFCLRYPARVGLLLVLLYSLGFFRLVEYLWLRTP